MNVLSLRNLTVDLLMDATDAGSSVFNSKATPTMPASLPAMSVYFKNVDAQQQSRKGVSFTESGTIEIDVMVASTVSWADVADTVIDQIKNIL